MCDALVRAWVFVYDICMLALTLCCNRNAVAWCWTKSSCEFGEIYIFVTSKMTRTYLDIVSWSAIYKLQSNTRALFTTTTRAQFCFQSIFTHWIALFLFLFIFVRVVIVIITDYRFTLRAPFLDSFLACFAFTFALFVFFVFCLSFRWGGASWWWGEVEVEEMWRWFVIKIGWLKMVRSTWLQMLASNQNTCWLKAFVYLGLWSI